MNVTKLPHRASRANRFRMFLGLLIVALAAPTELYAAAGKPSVQSGHNDLFLGLDWSADLSAASWNSVTHPTLDSITSIITLGDRRFFPFLPVRGRISFGWFPGYPFRVGAGVEIALIEILNQYDARGFGIYAFLDEIALFGSPTELVPRAMLGVLLPITATGGICVEAGVTSGGRPTFALTLMNGGYLR